MKIKTVCERTGLTDRAVRHYIEEELIHPAYTENYLGRRTFDFTEADVTRLSEIATLRKFDFSVEEIRHMLRDSTVIPATVAALRARKAALIGAEETLLRRLSEVEVGEGYTVSELAAFLATPAEEIPAPPDRSPIRVARLLWKLVLGLFATAIALFPIGMTAFFVISDLQYFIHPVFSPIAIVLSLLGFLPTVLFFTAHRLFRKASARKPLRIICLCLCVLLLPYNFACCFFIVERSETQDINDYRDIDPTCPATTDRFYQNLFPIRPAEPIDQTGDYKNGYFVFANDDRAYSYYHEDFFDRTYHIYAEWTLSPGTFSREVARVEALYDSFDPNESFENWILDDEDYVIYRMRQGTYQCLVLSVRPKSEPFEAPEDGDMFSHYIFAYDEESRRVRYIVDDTQCSIGTPFYMTLDW